MREEVWELRPITAPANKDRKGALNSAKDRREKERILRAIKRAEGAFHILFIHADGKSNPHMVRKNHIEPAVELISKELGHSPDLIVGVVPVKEMEAWTFADGDALRSAFGARAEIEDHVLGIPEGGPAMVEKIEDPKLALEEAYKEVVKGRRSKKKAVDFLPAIAESIQLDFLRRVPSFQRFELDLKKALYILVGYSETP